MFYFAIIDSSYNTYAGSVYACLGLCLPEGQLTTWPGGWLGMGTHGFPVLDGHFLVSTCLVGSICHVPNATGDGNTDLHLYYHYFVMCLSYGEILLGCLPNTSILKIPRGPRSQLLTLPSLFLGLRHAL